MTAAPLVSLNIARPTNPELTGAAGVLEMAGGYVVADTESYQLAGAEVLRIAATAKKLEEQRLAITRPMDAAKTEVMNLFRGPLEALARARSTIEGKMLTYRREEDRKRQEREAEQRRIAEAEALRLQSEALERASTAEAAGDHERAQHALEEAAAPPPPPPVVMAAPPRAAGVSVRQIWKAECTDLDALIKAAAAGHQLARACLVADPKVLGAQARALQERFVVPGVRVWPEDSMAARTA